MAGDERAALLIRLMLNITHTKITNYTLQYIIAHIQFIRMAFETMDFCVTSKWVRCSRYYCLCVCMGMCGLQANGERKKTNKISRIESSPLECQCNIFFSFFCRFVETEYFRVYALVMRIASQKTANHNEIMMTEVDKISAVPACGEPTETNSSEK